MEGVTGQVTALLDGWRDRQDAEANNKDSWLPTLFIAGAVLFFICLLIYSVDAMTGEIAGVAGVAALVVVIGLVSTQSAVRALGRARQDFVKVEADIRSVLVEHDFLHHRG